MKHNNLKIMDIVDDLSNRQKLRRKVRAIDNQVARIKREAARELARLNDIRVDANKEIKELTIRKIASKNGVGRGFVDKVHLMWLSGKV